MAILKANYLPKSQSGRISRSVAYYTWREGTDQQPRSWRDQDGRELGYNAAKEEVVEQASEASYTYRIVLSTRDATLDRDEYALILDRHVDRFYLTTHHAGDHPHAHAIAFSDSRLGTGDLAEMRHQLRELELDHERQLEFDAANEQSL
jgi:hypothetical protein